MGCVLQMTPEKSAGHEIWIKSMRATELIAAVERCVGKAATPGEGYASRSHPSMLGHDLWYWQRQYRSRRNRARLRGRIKRPILT
jgi:hypothetical protein